MSAETERLEMLLALARLQRSDEDDAAVAEAEERVLAGTATVWDELTLSTRRHELLVDEFRRRRLERANFHLNQDLE